MQVNAPQMQTKNTIDHLLAQADRFIWPENAEVDTDSKAFFVFRPYPKHIKRNQIEQWAQLQCKALSPFVGGKHYHYLSKVGLHLWISQVGFRGLPETALQKPLNNGTHLTAGTKHFYQQTWSEGLLMSCLVVEPSAQQNGSVASTLEIDNGAPWAVTRNIDHQIKTPTTWLSICVFLLICGVIWHSVGILTLNFQYSHAESEAEKLQGELGEKLSRQDRVKSQQRSLANLQKWQNEFGYLPETFAAIVDKINLQGKWKANSIAWQNRTLVLELISTELDIASLVSALEQEHSLARVNIRPHVNENTWILEATLK
jgi:hypothetical protein